MTVLQKTKKIRESSEGGFSLIEVAIGLIILGLLMAPIIHTYNLYIKARQVSQSDGVVRLVNSALLKYFEKEGHYPTPASPGIAQGAVGFGAADGTATPPICTPTSTVMCTTNVGTFGGTDVLIGAVPFATLGIPFKSVLDGYGNRLSYAVTEILTHDPALGDFDDDAGAIEILNSDGSAYFDPGTRAHFIVISHGEDGRGAFTLSGVRAEACGTAADGADSENCDNDGVFSNYAKSSVDTTLGIGIGQKTRAYSAGATHFDDFTAEVRSTAFGIWSFIPNTSLEMKATNLGNVYVGDTSVERITTSGSPDCVTNGTAGTGQAFCVPKTKVDVDGAVRATEILTERICPLNESNCINDPSGAGDNPRETPGIAPFTVPWFSPKMLTGADRDGPTTAFDPYNQGYVGGGLRCYNGTALKGFRNMDELCAHNTTDPATSTPYLPPTYTLTSGCASGTFANSVTMTYSGGTGTIALNCVSP